MGRHRSDPRGLARILVAAIAVVLALTLLVVGIVALVNALTSKGTAPASTGSASVTATAQPSSAETSTGGTTTGVLPLQITVTGKATKVFVRVSGTNGKVLQSGTLNTGETRRYDQAPLNVVVDDPESVEVSVYGKPTRGQVDAEGRASWLVAKR